MRWGFSAGSRRHSSIATSLWRVHETTGRHCWLAYFRLFPLIDAALLYSFCVRASCPGAHAFDNHHLVLMSIS